MWRWWRVAVWLVLLGACGGMAGLWLFRSEIGRELTRAAEASVNQRLAGSGWRLRLGRAALEDSSTIRIDRLEMFRDSDSGRAAFSLGPLRLSKHNLDRLLEGDWLPDLVALEASELQVDLSQCEKPALERLLQALQNPNRPLQLPALRIRDCRVIVDRGVGRNREPLLLYDLDLTGQSEVDQHQRPVFRLEGTARGALTGNSGMVLRVWPAERFVSGELRMKNWTARKEDLDWLPAAWLQRLGTIRLLQAHGDARLEFAGGTQQLPLWQLAGQVRELAVDSSRLPQPVTDARFSFQIDPQQIRASDLRMNLGVARVEGGWTSEWNLATGVSPRWQTKGRIENLDLDAVPVRELPPMVVRWIEHFSPRGRTHLEFDLGWDGERSTRYLNASIQDMSFAWYRFPYALENCVGSAILRNDECRFAVQSLNNGQIIEVNGNIQSPGPDATFRVEFGCRGEVPIDEKLLSALEQHPQIARQVRDLRPRGSIAVSGKLVREAAGTRPVLDYRVDLKQCQVRHVRFDYPLRDVAGQIVVNGDEVRFLGLRGRNTDSVVQAAGEWAPTTGLQLRFLAERLALDSQLRAALPPSALQVWDAVRPSGSIDLVRSTLTVGPQKGAVPQLVVSADAEVPELQSETGMAIRPVAFPLQLNRIAAHFEWGEGVFRVKHFRGEHGRAWVTGAASGTFQPEGWQLDLEDLVAGGLTADEDFLGALPREVSRALQQIRLAADLQVSGAMRFTCAAEPLNVPALPEPENRRTLPPPTVPVGPVALVGYSEPETVPDSGSSARKICSSLWNLRIDLMNGRANLGVPLENISGAVLMEGRETDGRFNVSGSLELDSLSCFGAWVSGLKGPLWMDNDRAAVGMFATPSGQSTPGTPSLQGKLFGGQFSLDGQTWSADGGRYYCQATLAGGELSHAAGCLDSEFCETGGAVSGGVRCNGSIGQPDSLAGEGALELSNARLYELPVMMGVLKSLRRRDADRTAFDSGTINFGLRGDQIDLNRIELNGDALTLIGNGTMDWHRRIKLDFYSMMGRNRLYIPGLSELAQASSQQIMWVTVDGTIDQPNLGQEILPGINEGLRMLLESPLRTARAGSANGFRE